MQKLLKRISERVVRHAGKTSMETALPGVSVVVSNRGGNPEFTMCRPGVCLVLQGTKQLVIGDETLRQRAGTSFISVVEMPATRCLFNTDADAPYVAVGLTIDHGHLGSLLADLPSAHPRESASWFGMAGSPSDLLEAWDHYLALFDAHEDIPALAVARERELLYRMLQSPLGPLLRQMTEDAGRPAQIRRAIDWIRGHFDQPLAIKTLAEIARMSVPAFNRHFRSATSNSPLQYQKMLRLQAARHLLAKDNNVARTAHAVGYGSATQFSREYSRYFGCSPKHDSLLMREFGGPDAMI